MNGPSRVNLKDKELRNSCKMCSAVHQGEGAGPRRPLLTCAGWLGFPTWDPDSPLRCWIGPSAEVASSPWCFASGSRALAQAEGLAIASSLTFDLLRTPSG